MKKINQEIYNFTGDLLSSNLVGERCSFEGCEDKVEVVLSVDDVINGLKVEKLYPVCSKHKEDVLSKQLKEE